MATRARNLPYAAKDQMDPQELTSFAARGGRFRSRPGAPMAQPNQGLSAPDPMRRARADASWGATFGERSVYGGRETPAAGAYGSSNNPLRFNSSEQDALGAKKSAIAATATPFMPDNPDAIHKRVIEDGLAYLAENGIPAPSVPLPAGVDTDVNERILGKYQTKGTTANVTYRPGQNAGYRSRRAALSL